MEYKNEDFVLKVKVDQALIKRVEKYEVFLSALCGKYYFQQEAVYEAIKFLFSPRYGTIWDLAKENFAANERLRNWEQWSGSDARYKKYFHLSNKKSCSLDLATGAGKSFVMYGVAQIMLAEGLVDQVLVLCPSKTIESGLTEKFTALAGDRNLRRLLPEGGNKLTPRITNGTRTIKKWDICIENIHAVYGNAGSSIYDSLRGKGARTLVLNDEAHHIFNTRIGEDSDIRKWHEFLVNKDYGFSYVVNLSGTPYMGGGHNDYFVDVIYRYPLKNGMEEGYLKNVEYKIESGSDRLEETQSFQEIWQNHQENKKKYKKVKPVSIIITADIAKCVEVWAKLVKFISEEKGIAPANAEKQVIWVVSGIPAKGSSAGQKIYRLVDSPERQRQENLAKLKEVDDKKSPVEWIVSVAMLTEGWDVKNVFQIVPHESRAFNSRLLIAQVLGRGLRIPDAYRGQKDIKVRVYNHIKFSSEIKDIVNQVLETEERFSWFPVRDKYDFPLDNLDYIQDLEKKQVKLKQPKFSEDIAFASQTKNIRNYNVFRDILTGEDKTTYYELQNSVFTIDAAAKSIWSMLAAYDTDTGSDFKVWYPVGKIKKILEKNLPRNNKSFVSYENLNRAKTAFGKLFDVPGSIVYFKSRADQIINLDTSEINRQSISAASTGEGREAMCFYADDTIKSLSSGEQFIFQKYADDEKFKFKRVESSKFKTSLNCVCTNYEPERKFAKDLFQNVDLIDSFIKSPDHGFYSIPYSFKKGTHMKYLGFNPDFFLKKGRDILVVEIKSDNDLVEENRAKLRDSKKHFEELNDQLRGKKASQHYFFYFLSPQDYSAFFQAIREKSYDGWESGLMQALRSS